MADIVSRLQMIENRDAMTITVGAKVFDRPFLARLPENNFHLKDQIAPTPAAGLKETNKFYCDLLGPKFNRRFQAAMYYMWLGDRMSRTTSNMLRLSGYRGWRHYSDSLVYMANQVLPYVHEAEADGLFHLIPAIVVFGAHPSTIRREIGPAAWRRIAHNSRTRNMRIMQVADNANRHLPLMHQDYRNTFVKLLDVRSGLLGGFSIVDEDTLAAARIAPRSTARSLMETMHMVRDARRMIGTINPDWSLARIRREHDAAVTARRRQTYSAEDFAAPWSFSADGLDATLLTSPLSIAVEGDSQHHCVGSYWHEAKEGRYAVLKVEGKERATIGLRHHRDGWVVDQVYAACNAPVSSECRAFSFKVANKLNAAGAEQIERAA